MLLDHRPRREGTVAVVAALSMIVILSFVALSLDGGMLLDKRRSAQAGADAAAYAAACELYVNWFNKAGLDDAGSTAKTLALAVAKDNGFEDGKDGVKVTVNIPPKSGPNAGRNGHVEVLISADQPRAFSHVFGSSSKIPVGARAVARGMRTTVNNGILVLNPEKEGALTIGGGGTGTVTGSAMVIVNSMAADAMVANGGGSMAASTYKLATLDDTGYATPGGGKFYGDVKTRQEPTPDPLRFIPEPTTAGMKLRSTKKIQHSGASQLTLLPGVYEGGVSITGKGNVLMESGVYYMRGGGFSVSGTAEGRLVGNEVMIFNDPTSTSDNINIGGSGSITLTPPTSGTYQGIVLFQHRTGIQPTVSVTGNGTAPMYITGTFYVPGGELSVTGNGTQDTIGAQYISDTLKVDGNGAFNVHWDPDIVPGIRSIYLVE